MFFAGISFYYGIPLPHQSVRIFLSTRRYSQTQVSYRNRLPLRRKPEDSQRPSPNGKTPTPHIGTSKDAIMLHATTDAKVSRISISCRSEGSQAVLSDKPTAGEEQMKRQKITAPGRLHNKIRPPTSYLYIFTDGKTTSGTRSRAFGIHPPRRARNRPERRKPQSSPSYGPNACRPCRQGTIILYLTIQSEEIGPKPGPYLSRKNTKASPSVGEPLFVRSYVSGYRSPLPYLAFGTAFCRSLPNTGSEPAHPRPQPQTAGEQLSERKNVAGNPGPFYGSLLLSLHPDRTATVRPISTIRRNDGCNRNGPSAPEYPCRRFWGKNSLWETDGAGRRRSDTYCPARRPSD